MMNYFCRHHYEPMYLMCPQCEQNAGVSSEHIKEMVDAANQREREELAKELFVKFCVAEGYKDAHTDEIAHEAFRVANEFIWEREKRRRKNKDGASS